MPLHQILEFFVNALDLEAFISTKPDEKNLQQYRAYCPKRIIIAFRYYVYNCDLRKLVLSVVCLSDVMFST